MVPSRFDQASHLGALAVNDVEVPGIEPCMDQQTDELFEHDADFRLRLDEGSVAHGQRADQLQRRDFEREIERRNDYDRAVGKKLFLVFSQLTNTRGG